jgi:hypothetical protein
MEVASCVSQEDAETIQPVLTRRSPSQQAPVYALERTGGAASLLAHHHSDSARIIDSEIIKRVDHPRRKYPLREPFLRRVGGYVPNISIQ